MILLRKALRRAATPRLWACFVLPNLGFACLAALTSAGTLIPILNLVAIALSVNVCVAFATNVFDAIFADRPIDRADLLTLGIFCSWFALVLRTGWSIVWRSLGQPFWLANTDFSSYFIFMSACGAVFHLLAPGSLKATIPPARWVRIGAVVGLAVFAALLLLYLTDLRGRAIMR